MGRAARGALGEAIAHFGLRLREGTTLTDLACAIASLIEGVVAQPVPDHAPPVGP